MEKFNQAKYQENWDKENMSQVKVAYKKSFVEEFKHAVRWLNDNQSSIIRQAMQDTISKAKIMQNEEIENLKEKIVTQIEKCDKLSQEDNVYLEASTRYHNFIATINNQLSIAERDHLNVYVINDSVYITDGSRIGNGISQYISKGKESTTRKIIVPRNGTYVTVEQQLNPVFEPDKDCL